MKPTPSARPNSVWVRPSDNNQDLQQPFLEYLASTGVEIERSSAPSKDALIILTPVGYDVTTAVNDLKLDGARTVAVDVLFGLKGPRSVMVSPAIDPKYREMAHGLMGHDGQPAIIINDSPGFVAQRAGFVQLGPDLIGDAKPAVQPGRQIATIRSAAGLGVVVALMTP